MADCVQQTGVTLVAATFFLATFEGDATSASAGGGGGASSTVASAPIVSQTVSWATRYCKLTRLRVRVVADAHVDPADGVGDGVPFEPGLVSFQLVACLACQLVGYSSSIHRHSRLTLCIFRFVLWSESGGAGDAGVPDKV